MSEERKENIRELISQRESISKQFWAMSLPSQRHMYAFWEDAKTACGGPRFLGYPSI